MLLAGAFEIECGCEIVIAPDAELHRMPGPGVEPRTLRIGQKLTLRHQILQQPVESRFGEADSALALDMPGLEIHTVAGRKHP